LKKNIWLLSAVKVTRFMRWKIVQNTVEHASIARFQILYETNKKEADLKSFEYFEVE